MSCFEQLFKMKLLFPFATASALSASLVVVSLLSPVPIQSGPLSLANKSLEGPLKDYVVTVDSWKSVDDVIDLLQQEFLKRGFIVKGIINHQDIAKSQAIEIPPNKALLVGLPSFEAPVIKANPLGGLFVPLTVSVWQANEKTRISYWNPKTDIGSNLLIHESNAVKALDDMTLIFASVVNSVR